MTDILSEVVELDYAFLREQGIAYIQQLAGKKWTDYGNHDPGVTILEVLVFAIIDLEYRANFHIEDIWANHTDAVDKPKEKQFYRAEEILPCNPITQWDYLKILLDIPGIKDANILLTDGLSEIKGGYRVFVALEGRIRNTSKEEEVLHLVKERLYAHRNLCEDFFSIEAMQLLPVGIKAKFEVHNCLAYEEGESIVAKILYHFCEFLSPRITFYSISQLLNKGKTIDQIFTGPLLSQGFIDEEELIYLKKKKYIYVIDFIEKAINVTGIKGVLHFELFMEDEKGMANHLSIPVLPDRSFVLDIANSEIFLSYNGVPIVVAWEQVLHLLEDMKGRGTLTKAYLQEEDIFVLEGNYRNLAQFISIQQDFPLLYNVGHEGCAPSDTLENHAKAKQLKGYLMFFDQLLANYFGLLSNVKHKMAMHSKVWNRPDGHLPLEVPAMRAVVKEPTQEANPGNDLEFVVQRKYLAMQEEPLSSCEEEQSVVDEQNKVYLTYVNRILESNIRTLDKRSRMLDHLLAYFAEQFATYSLYLYPKNEEDQLAQLNMNKTLFLKDYIGISKNRSSAPRFIRASDGSIHYKPSGFKRRIYRSLGIKNLEVGYFHQVVKHNLYVEQNLSQPSFEMFLGKNYHTESADLLIFKGKYANIQSLAIDYGVNEEHYHIYKKHDESYAILLYVDKFKKHNIELMAGSNALTTMEEAEKIVQQSIALFRSLNEKCEGFHLIEHILLRDSDSIEREDNFYSFRMTMVFPAWPARFREASFRHAVEEMLISEGPAHLLVGVLWLDFDAMEVFEKAHRRWIELKTDAQATKIEIDKAANALMNIILSHSGQLNANGV